VIHEVDEALRSLLSEEILGETGAEVAFEAPTREWVARRSGAPAVNVFLYDVREDLHRRQTGRRTETDDRGRAVALREPSRWYTLSYLVTAWTARPQDEHRLLSLLLAALVGEECLPPARLTGSLAELGLTVPVSVALPPAENRATADVWSALGGELKPSLDVVVTAPLAPRARPAGPLVTDGLELRAVDRGSGTQAAHGGTQAAHGGERRRARYQGAPEGQTAPPPDAAPTLGARRVRGTPAGGTTQGTVRR
jgi:hypothetical protein